MPESFEDFFYRAIKNATNSHGRGVMDATIYRAMFEELHARVTALEVAAKPAEAHAPGDAADPR